METPSELFGVRGTSSDDPSGHKLARQAHDAGAVEPTVERPTCSVWLEFRVHDDAAVARELADAVAERLVEHPLVVGSVAVTVTEATL